MLKHLFSFLAGAGMLGDTVLPILAGDHISWLRWRVPIIVCGAIALLGLAIQLFLTYKEEKRFNHRVETALQALVAERGIPLAEVMESKRVTPPPTLAPSIQEPIDGELYRIAASPRSVAWPIVRDVFRLQGRPDEAKIDTDILIEMYLVNRSMSTKYVRDIALSVEVAGKRIQLMRQPDLEAEEVNGKRYEYGLKFEKHGEAQPIKQLTNEMPMVLAPEQPTEGWIKFMASEINPESIDDKTWQLAIEDSLGNCYPISKVSSRAANGELSILRLRQ